MPEGDMIHRSARLRERRGTAVQSWRQGAGPPATYPRPACRR